MSMSTKSSNVYVRIEPDVKDRAERILSELGVSTSAAINMFYRQIILHGGLPFEVKFPSTPVTVNTLSTDELHAELEKGYSDILAGRTVPAKQAIREIRKGYLV